MATINHSTTLQTSVRGHWLLGCLWFCLLGQRIHTKFKMAGARHLRGTIYTRVANLLRSGAMKSKPVWFDVVEAFPPLVDTKINRKPESGRVTKLEYPEDYFRRKFYSAFKTYGALDLKDGENPPPTDCEIFVKKCQDFVSQGLEQEEAFEKASQDFMSDIPTYKQQILSERQNTIDMSPDEGDAVTDIYGFLTSSDSLSKQKPKKVDE